MMMIMSRCFRTITASYRSLSSSGRILLPKAGDAERRFVGEYTYKSFYEEMMTLTTKPALSMNKESYFLLPFTGRRNRVLHLRAILSFLHLSGERKKGSPTSHLVLFPPYVSKDLWVRQHETRLETAKQYEFCPWTDRWEHVRSRREDRHTKEVEHVGCELNNTKLHFFTSATSGSLPKEIILDAQKVQTNLDQLDVHVPEKIMNASSVHFAMLPWFHCYGFTCELLLGIRRRVEFRLPLSDQVETWISELRAHRPSGMMTVPYVLERIDRKTANLSLLSPSSTFNNYLIFGGLLRHVSVGGASCSAALIDRLERRFGFRIYMGYGMTECSPMISLETSDDDATASRGSSGRLLPNVEVKICEKTQEIMVAGPNVHAPEGGGGECKKAVRVFLRTGDTGYLSDSRLFVTGRLSNHVKLSNGKFLDLEFVDRELMKIVSSTSSLISLFFDQRSAHGRWTPILAATVLLQPDHLAVLFVSADEDFHHETNEEWIPCSEHENPHLFSEIASAVFGKSRRECLKRCDLFCTSLKRTSPFSLFTLKMTPRRTRIVEFLQKKKYMCMN